MILLAVLFAAISGFLWPRAHSPAVRRYTALTSIRLGRTLTWTRHPHDASATPPRHNDAAPGRPPPNTSDRAAPPTKTRRDLLTRCLGALLSGIACALLLGGLLGALVGLVMMPVVARALGRLGHADRRRRRARLVADLPVAIDLLAACLQGGTPWSDAVEAVARAVAGPVGEELHRVAVQIRLGVDPSTAWLSLADEPALAPLARTVIRAANSGTAVAPTLTRLARDRRRAARVAAIARARAAGIRVLAPLGLCFLPAFVLLGIVPTIAGIASTVLLPW
ncbi:MAG: type II secretion system F family protein [Actinomadura rubrobrunea]|nr:type II secretion system F family protein [Actinomadura rubrobrunea]